MTETETDVGDGGRGAAGTAPDATVGGGLVPPLLLALFDDFYDEAGDKVALDPVRWALSLPEGAGLTFDMASASSATLWLNLDDAIDAEARVSAVVPVDPRPYPQWKREQR